MLNYEQELVGNLQSHIVNAEVTHVKKFVTKDIDNEFLMCMYYQNNLAQDAAKHEVPSHNVSQNVCNLTGRHVCALQSNSKSAQDGGWSNNGGGIHRERCVVGNFASMTKTECPCTSSGIAVSDNTLNCKNHDHLHSYKVQFTNWYQISDNYNAYIVHIQQFLHENSFFWLVQDNLSQEMHIYACDAIPDGPLVIIHSQEMFIKSLDTKIQLLSEQEKSNAKVVAMNFFQDQYAFENYHMSYEQYMDRVILSLIERQDKISNDKKCESGNLELTVANTCINVTNNTNNIVQEDLSIPHYFEAQTGYKLDKNVTDVNVKNKTRAS